jgi:hypothetical protein
MHEPPHVTFVAFDGKDRAAQEVALAAFSLSRVSYVSPMNAAPQPGSQLPYSTRTARRPRTTMHVLTDTASMARQLVAADLPPAARVRQIDREYVLRRFDAFGIRKFAHHSGLGGYSKLLIAELLPPRLNASILVDTDTVFVADVAPLWALRHRLARSGAALAAKRLSTGGTCLRGQRLNSGVVLMDLQRMRATNWTETLLARLARLGRGGVPARLCGKSAPAPRSADRSAPLQQQRARGPPRRFPTERASPPRAAHTRGPPHAHLHTCAHSSSWLGAVLRNNGSTLAAGDQELVSYGCLQAGAHACQPLPAAMHVDKCDGFAGAGRAIVVHFNCGGSAPSSCPTPGCSRIVRDFASRQRPTSG